MENYYKAWIAGLCALCLVLAVVFNAGMRKAVERTVYVAETVAPLVVL